MCTAATALAIYWTCHLHWHSVNMLSNNEDYNFADYQVVQIINK